MKKWKALLPLFLNFALEYATRKVHENYDGLKLRGTHKLVDDTNILVKKNTTRKNIDHLLVSRREEGIAVNARKITYVFISQQNAE